MPTEKITILYVDDEENNLFSFKATFRIKYNVLTALSGDAALLLRISGCLK
jgi:response regulator RpfG family c-di-GMP phosphodiesterase